MNFSECPAFILENMMDRKELEAKIISKAWKDPQFKENLLEDPKTTIEAFIHVEYGADAKLPKMKFHVLESNPHTLIIVLPPSPVEAQKITEVELETISAGKGAILSPFIGL